MTRDLTRNFRLVVATTLVSLWAFAHLARTPVLGDSLLPLLLALLIAPGSVFVRWRTGRAGVLALVGAVLAFLALTLLLYGASESAQELRAFSHSPYFVVPVWALALFGLARNATSAERSEAPVSAAVPTPKAHVPDAKPPAKGAGRRS